MAYKETGESSYFWYSLQFSFSILHLNYCISNPRVKRKQAKNTWEENFKVYFCQITNTPEGIIEYTFPFFWQRFFLLFGFENITKKWREEKKETEKTFTLFTVKMSFFKRCGWKIIVDTTLRKNDLWLEPRKPREEEKKLDFF